MMMAKGVRGRRVVLWLGIGWLVLLVATGCARERNDQGAREDAKEQALTAEIAKKTLLEMAPSQIPPGVTVHLPKDEPIEVVGPDEIAVGGWTCNLKEKTFHASFAFPDAPRHKQNHVTGVFQRTPDGKWVAKVTQSQSGG
jgi:hypothetical protein